MGTRPIKSRCTRRQNMASSLKSDGGMRRSLSFAKTCSSIKLFSGGSFHTSPGIASRKTRRLVATMCSYDTRIVASPDFRLTTSPGSPTWAIAVSVELKRARLVTSRIVPSAKRARTTSCCTLAG